MSVTTKLQNGFPNSLSGGSYRQVVDTNCQVGVFLIERTAFVVKTPQSISRLASEHDSALIEVAKEFDK